MASYGSHEQLLALVFALFALCQQAPHGKYFRFWGPAEVTATNGKSAFLFAEVNTQEGPFLRLFPREHADPLLSGEGRSGTLRVAFDACDVCFRKEGLRNWRNDDDLPQLDALTETHRRRIGRVQSSFASRSIFPAKRWSSRQRTI